jgi:uncharacterized protein (TIGR00297 family)
MFTDLLVGFLLAGTIALVSCRWGVLSLSGAVATTCVGTAIFGLGGWDWSAPVLYFFISSSALSKIREAKKSKLKQIFQKDERRDWAQVLANGVLPALCAIFDFIQPHQWWYILYLAALSSATADTWATEIGVLSKESPVLVTTFQPVSVGTSGGITTSGTLASFGGAVSLTAIGLCIFPAYSLSIRHLIILIGAGFLASFFDSILGATIQAQYVCQHCQRRTERKFHCQNLTTRISGWRWVNNDWVNFISGLFVAGLTFLLIKV